MKKTVWSEIVIAAPPADVWKVLTNTARYAEWNPFIVRLEGRLELGQRLDATLALKPDRQLRFRPVVVRVIDGRELRWIGHAGFAGLFDGEHSLALEPEEGGRTRVVHQEIFRGILVPFLWPFLKHRIERGFAAMNEALRRRVETSAADGRMMPSET
ncbi:MAG TPA: SRPBCC domain-containing protein [Gammaproteobacteria bacterium]|nr:SRPBCC domain-containing protein [Gammaproteobacteria bacterium]